MRVREQTLDILAKNTPTVVAGDINTPECILRQWMDDNDATNSLSLACSGASPTLHGDFTISNNVMMWQTAHQVGKSFEMITCNRLTAYPTLMTWSASS